MSVGELSNREAVLQATAEYDALGSEAFLAKYGYGRAKAFWLVHEGKKYDSKAIAGAAYGYQFPARGPLANSDFSGGEQSVQGTLEALGFKFEVTATPAQISKWFRNLSVSTIDGKPAPHKPLLSLLALRGVSQHAPRLSELTSLANELGRSTSAGAAERG